MYFVRLDKERGFQVLGYRGLGFVIILYLIFSSKNLKDGFVKFIYVRISWKDKIKSEVFFKGLSIVFLNKIDLDSMYYF